MESSSAGKLVRPKLWFDEGFTQIPNAWLRDKRLTYTTRGVLGWMLSHEAGFEVTITSIAAGTTHGRDSIRSCITQLEKCGYLRRYQRRERGRIVGTVWELRDPWKPVDNPGLFERDLKALNPLKSEKAQVRPATGFPAPVEPSPVEPSPVNPTTIEEQLKEHLTNDVKNVTIDGPVDNLEPDGAPISREPVTQTFAQCGHIGYWPAGVPVETEPLCVLDCQAFREATAELKAVAQ